MANLLHVGDEFDSYKEFERALQQYCEATKVNDESVKFVHSNSRNIKNDSVPADVQQRLIYTHKTGRCTFAGRTPCKAAYKLVFHTKENGDHVLRLDKFDSEHSSHIEFVQYNAALAPQPDKPILRSSSSSSSSNIKIDSKNKLQSIANKIHHGAYKWSDPQCDAIAEILENVLNRAEKNITYKVDFMDMPLANGPNHHVDIVTVGDRSRRKKANAYKVIDTIDLIDLNEDNSNDNADAIVPDSEASESSESVQSEQSDESSQEQSVNNTGIVEEVASKSVSKTNPSNNGNNSAGEHSGDSSSESEAEAMDNDQTRALDENESSEQSSESVADDSLMAVQSEEVSGKNIDSNNNKNRKKNDSESSGDADDESMEDELGDGVVGKKLGSESVANESLASKQSEQAADSDGDSGIFHRKETDDERTNGVHDAVENEPDSENETNESLAPQQNEQIADKGRDIDDSKKGNDLLGDPKDASIDDEHTNGVNDVVEKESDLEKKANESMAPQQNEQIADSGVDIDHSKEGNSKDSDSLDDLKDAPTVDKHTNGVNDVVEKESDLEKKANESLASQPNDNSDADSEHNGNEKNKDVGSPGGSVVETMAQDEKMSQANGDLPAIVHDETHETAHKMEAEEFMTTIYLQPIGARKKRPISDECPELEDDPPSKVARLENDETTVVSDEA